MFACLAPAARRPTEPHAGRPTPRQVAADEPKRQDRPMVDERVIPGGVVHDLPGDFEQALRGSPAALATWADITPLARNEWICWIQSAKKAETRVKRIHWGRDNLSEGKRRPCCWPGCPHR